MDPKLLKTFKELGDLYQILGTEPTKDEKVLKASYKDMAKKLHPDKNPDPNAKEMYIRLKQAYDILMHPELKVQYDKYKDNQKHHEERVKSQNKVRRNFGEELLKREKANQENSEGDKQHKMTKEERERQESKRMKREWEEEEEKRKDELEKKRKVEKVESKEYTMIKVKWPKANQMTYTQDILKIIFGKHGEIKDITMFPNDRKALIEYRYRLSAEKAYNENKAKEDEKTGFDDGVKVSLLVKEKKEEKPAGQNDLSLNSGNLQKISGLFNRDSKLVLGTREEELRKAQERQRIIEEMLAKEGII